MIKKLLFFLFSFTLLILTSLPSTSTSFAQGTPACSARADSVKQSEGQTSPVPADSNDKAISIEMNTGGLEGDVSILIKPPSIGEPQRLFKEERDEMATFHVESDGKIIIPLIVLRRGFFKTGPRDDQSDSNLNLESGTYNIYVVPSGEQNSSRAYCTPTVEVKPKSGGSSNYCSVSYLTAKNDYTFPGTSVYFKVEFHQSSNTGDSDTHRVILRSRYGDKTWTPTTAALKTNDGWKIPDSLVAGTYTVIVREFAKSLVPPFDDEGKACSPEWPFLIETDANGGGHECSLESTGCDYKDVVPNAALSQPCDSKTSSDWSNEKGCLRIKTALGTIGTEAPEFVRWVLGFVLGISGGIVLIIIIITGYKLMTSQGDPEKIKNAKDALTAAIVGLLFIIFSLVILQFITADILQLPGFGS